MSGPQITFRRIGDALYPWGRHQNRFGSLVAEGEDITLVPAPEDRSARSHRHFFACVHEAWSNLPEEIAEEPWAVSAESLRKRALIREGYSTATAFACASRAEAERLAAALRAVCPDEYSEAVVQGTAVTLLRAKSQSERSMGRKEFEASKDAVLSHLASLCRISVEVLSDTAGSAA